MQLFLAIGLLFFIVFGAFGYTILRQKILERLRSHHSKTIAPTCLSSQDVLGSRMMGFVSRRAFLNHFILHREYRALKDDELYFLGRCAFFLMIFSGVCGFLLFATLVVNFEDVSKIHNEFFARVFG